MPVCTYSATLKDHIGNKLNASVTQDNLVGNFVDYSAEWVDFLETYSYAKAISRSDGETHPMGDVTVTDPTKDGFDLVGNKAVLNLRRKGGPLNLTDAKPMRISIPAAKDTMFEAVPGKRDMQVKRSVGEEIAAALSAMLNETITFVDGSQYTK